MPAGCHSSLGLGLGLGVRLGVPEAVSHGAVGAGRMPQQLHLAHPQRLGFVDLGEGEGEAR